MQNFEFTKLYDIIPSFGFLRYKIFHFSWCMSKLRTVFSNDHEMFIFENKIYTVNSSRKQMFWIISFQISYSLCTCTLIPSSIHIRWPQKQEFFYGIFLNEKLNQQKKHIHKMLLSVILKNTGSRGCSLSETII